MSRHNISVTFRAGFIVTALLSADAVQARSYQSEARFLHNSTSTDSNSSTSSDFVGVFYFSPINEAGPLAEASFMARSSYVAASTGRREFDLLGANFDGDQYSLGFGYIPSGTGLLLEASLYESHYSALGYVDMDVSASTVSLGMFMDNYTLIRFSYESANSALTSFPDITGNKIDVSFKKLIDNINIEAGYSNYDASDGVIVKVNTNIDLSGDYYIDNTLSVGAGYRHNSGDDAGDEGTTLLIRVVKFASETTRFKLSYGRFSGRAAFM